MKWILDEFSRGYEQLKRWPTWVAIGLIGFFAALAYLVSRYALRTDALLQALHRGSGCRDLSNGAIIFLFCSMIFFLFTVLLTLGEFQRYFELRGKSAQAPARQALRQGIAWAAVALGISVAALVFFGQYCR